MFGGGLEWYFGVLYLASSLRSRHSCHEYVEIMLICKLPSINILTRSWIKTCLLYILISCLKFCLNPSP
jgi:hypothetical protein